MRNMNYVYRLLSDDRTKSHFERISEITAEHARAKLYFFR